MAAYVRADAAYLLAGQALTTGQTAHTRIDGYVPTITAAVLESDAAWTQTVALAGSAVQTEADTLDSVLLRGRTSTNVPSVGGLVLGDDYRLEEDPGVGFARFTLSDSNKYIICDAGNDGAASGFDADKLDGEHGSYYLSTGTAAATYGTTTRVEQAYALADAAPTWLEGSQTWVEVESDPIWSAASNLYPTWVAGSSAWLEAEANYSAGQSLPAVNAAAATNLTAANIAAGGRFGAIDGSALTNLPPALIDSPADFTTTNAATDGYALLGDASAGKLYWGQAGGGGGGANFTNIQLISRYVVNTPASSVSIAPIPQGYGDLVVSLSRIKQVNTSGGGLVMRPNNNASANYSYGILSGSGSIGTVSEDTSTNTTGYYLGVAMGIVTDTNCASSMLWRFADYTNSYAYRRGVGKSAAVTTPTDWHLYDIFAEQQIQGVGAWTSLVFATLSGSNIAVQSVIEIWREGAQ